MPRIVSILLMAAVVVGLPALRPVRPAATALAAGMGAGPIRHQVRSGESLWVLARQYNTTVARLAEINGLNRPELIHVDQVLMIPVENPAPEAASSPAVPEAAAVPPVQVRVLGLASAPSRSALLLAERDRPVPTPPHAPPQEALTPPARAAERAAPAAAPAEPAGPAVGSPVREESAAVGTAVPLIRAAVPSGRRLLALTFNGLPDSANSDLVLTALAQAGARATFFLSGDEAQAHPDMVRRLVAAGHEIGTLGRRGRAMDNSTRLAAEADILLAAQMLHRAGAPQPRFFRPPGGAYTADLLDGAVAAGMTPVLWSSIGLRERPGVAVQALAAQAAGAACPGAVLLLHVNRSESAAALPQILQALTATGYRSVTLSHFFAAE